MAGFTDLRLQSQPFMFSAEASGTEGRSWLWTVVDIEDAAGDLIDLTSGVTGEAKILTEVNGTVVLTLTVTLGFGEVSVSATPTQTATLANGDKARRCCWYLKLTGPSSTQVQVWGSRTSPFIIEPDGT